MKAENRKRVKILCAAIAISIGLTFDTEDEITKAEQEPVEITMVSDEQLEEQLVALTFDDGPSKFTIDLLNALDLYNIKATFFVLGQNIHKYPDAIIEAYNRGHEIAIHGYTHTSFKKMSIDEIQAEIDKTYQELLDLGIAPSILVRPPYGDITEKIMNNIENPMILWNIDTEDWKTRKSSVVENTIIKETNGKDNIILLHDIHESTVKGTILALPEIASKGYKFVTISELFAIKDIELTPGKKYYKTKTN